MRRQQPDLTGDRIDDRTGIAQRVRAIVSDYLKLGPRGAQIQAAPQDEVDIAGIAGARAPAFGKSEQRAVWRRDDRWNAIGVIRALAGDEDVGKARLNRILGLRGSGQPAAPYAEREDRRCESLWEYD